ncbi:response regulator [Halalkalibacter okhensis]|uniref:AraC family transcriptional regulator n=1 Tax=Halalkalibacter okhensis TaxID=333138 RepID=A0A0B0IPE6_9BACI|nr:response regulator [Halalkalibacter okhensis]KHF41556.1 hypothetical protein LQ50_02260 [Halalkalibacter okhensis]
MQKVIIVDDNITTAEGIRESIDWESVNATVLDIFSNGNDALAMLQKRDIDLIISDVNMPDLNGIDFAKLAIDIQTHVKVIFISAYSEFEYVKEAIRLDVCDYVEKPINYSYLLEVIEKTLQRVKDDRKIIDDLKKNRFDLIQKYLLDLIHSTPDYGQHFLLEQGKYLNITLDENFYLCTVIGLNNVEEIINEFGVERYHIWSLNAIQNIKKYLRDKYLFYYCTSGNRIILILGSTTKFNKHLLHEEFQECYSRLFNENFKLTIGIGSMVDRVWDLAKSYQNAEEALERKFLFGEQIIFDISDMKKEHSSPLINTKEDEDLLIKLVSSRSPGNIYSFFNKLEMKWAENNYSKLAISSYVHLILARLMKFTYDVDIEDKNILGRVNQLILQLNDYTSTEQICNHLSEICIWICEGLQESVDIYHRQLSELVIEYIHSNYHLQDLSVSSIAEHVNLNLSYLGSVFKKYKSTSISKYILEVRMEKAQELLHNTTLKIKDISEKVGYTNQYYFSASFKKYYNLTPSEIRNNNVPL